MAQDLQTASPASLPAIDTRAPSSLLLLPPWLARQLAEVSDLGSGRTELDPITKAIVRQVPTIPKSMMPTGPQRQAIARRIGELEQASLPGPDNDIVAIIGDLLLEYSPSRPDGAVTGARTDAYLDALEDLPAWAIKEAIRRWHRGEVSGDPRDLEFAPKPARLRRLAEGIATTASGQAIRLRRILAAEAEEPVSEAQAAENQRCYAEALKEAGVPDVQPAGSEAAERAEARRLLAQRFAEAEAERQARIAERAA